MSYLSYPQWVKILNPRDRKGGNSPWCFETEAWHKAYCAKHDICNALHPSSVLEIGVRYGYSAHAFLWSDSDMVYTGVDLDDASVNSMGEPTVAWAEAMLRNTISQFVHLVFHRVNTQQVDIRTLVRDHDFVHIDACHTYAGALRDMQIGWALAKSAMLVDDYKGSPAVRDAVLAFKRESGATMMTSDSGTGEALFLK